MTIDYYVRSRGSVLEQGYSWAFLSKEGPQRLQEPPIIDGEEVNQLIYRERFSVFLGCYSANDGQEKLVLQITGLNAGRLDHARRTIRNTLACISDTDESNDEMILRGIAVVALSNKEQLSTLVADTIHEFYDSKQAVLDKEGYRVDGAELISRLETLRLNVFGEDSVGAGVGKNVEKLRLEIADQLKYCHLPQATGKVMSRKEPYVVVTDLIIEETFCKYHVRLGLSDQIDKHLIEEEWAKLRPYKKFVNPPVRKPIQTRGGGMLNFSFLLSRNLRLLLLGLVLLLVVIIGLYLWR